MSGHDKGRDCGRTDEVLDNYRHRAVAAELEIARRRGRPTTGTRIEVRVPADVLAHIDELAAAQGLTRAVVIRDALVARFS